MTAAERTLYVWADWAGLPGPKFVGVLRALPSRREEIFSFEYDPTWLKTNGAQALDPNLGLFQGRQFVPKGRSNFGLFLDSCPDRWGRVLMLRREAQTAREEQRRARQLRESDYLLGVHDRHRIGGLRFRAVENGPFLDDNDHLASPPWTSLRELESASMCLEQDDAQDAPEYSTWLRMLTSPGGSLGGARPKASVLDEQGNLWIAKFPSRKDAGDIGAWEGVVHTLAQGAGIRIAEAQTRKFSGEYTTFLVKRFDRTSTNERIHFASAMTLLQRVDGDDASTGASYLEMAEFIVRAGAQPNHDLEELWRRIVFSICVSNTDDHLRNHGFLLGSDGWSLSPAYDVNPDPHGGHGLRLNISETSNEQDLGLALEVAKHFRVPARRAKEIIAEVTSAVVGWSKTAQEAGIPKVEQDQMAHAFSLAEH